MKILTSFLTALLFHLSSLTACPEDTIDEQKVPEIVKEEAESKGHENSLKTIDEVIEGIDSLLDDIDRTSGGQVPAQEASPQDTFLPNTFEGNSAQAEPTVGKKSSRVQEDFSGSPFDLLILGGGYSPSGNQFSLESNVKYFMRIRPTLGLEQSRMSLYFADGNAPDRDLQFFDPNFKIPLVNRALAEIIGRKSGLNYQYRSNDLPNDGASSLASLEKWISERKKASDKAINLIYFTGHGGKGNKEKPKNTTAYLWNNFHLKMETFAQKLESLPDGQACLFVMVQCYSGGFAQIIFKDGSSEKGLSDKPRAGFFATTHNRVAAGCTPDVRESDYREYSTQFWEALCGTTRTGDKVQKPDYDGDGRTSMSEAHAYVIIHSDTIDLPVKTSEIWLRTIFSPGFGEKKSTEKKDASGKLSELAEKIFSEEGWLGKILKNPLESKISMEELMNMAEPEERAILGELSRSLDLNGTHAFPELKRKIDSFKKAKDEAAKKKKDSLTETNKIKESIKTRIRKRYPELNNPFHPIVTKILKGSERENFLKLLHHKQEWNKFQQRQRKTEELEAQRFLFEKKEVKAIRLNRAMENVLLSTQLEETGTLNEKKDFSRLVDLERTTLPLPIDSPI